MEDGLISLLIGIGPLLSHLEIPTPNAKWKPTSYYYRRSSSSSSIMNSMQKGECRREVEFDLSDKMASNGRPLSVRKAFLPSSFSSSTSSSVSFANCTCYHRLLYHTKLKRELKLSESAGKFPPDQLFIHWSKAPCILSCLIRTLTELAQQPHMNMMKMIHSSLLQVLREIANKHRNKESSRR